MLPFNYFRVQTLSDVEQVFKGYSNKIISQNVFNLSSKNYLEYIKGLYHEIQRIKGVIRPFTIKEILIDTDSIKSISFLSVNDENYIVTVYAKELSQEQFKNHQILEYANSINISMPIFHIGKKHILQIVNNKNIITKTFEDFNSNRLKIISSIITSQSVIKTLIKKDKLIINSKTEEEVFDEYKKIINNSLNNFSTKTAESISTLFDECLKIILQNQIIISGFSNPGLKWNTYIDTVDSTNILDFSEIFNGNLLHDFARLFGTTLAEHEESETYLSTIIESLEENNIGKVIRLDSDSKKFIIKTLSKKYFYPYVIINTIKNLCEYANNCGLPANKNSRLKLEEVISIKDLKLYITTTTNESILLEPLCKKGTLSIEEYAEIVIKYCNILKEKYL